MEVVNQAEAAKKRFTVGEPGVVLVSKTGILYFFNVCFYICFTGCAHYYLPANHFQSPKSGGENRVGVLESLLQSGVDLTDPPRLKTTENSSELHLQQVWAEPVLRFSRPINENSEIVFSLQANAPLLLSYKRQLIGANQVNLENDNLGHGGFSLSIGATGGLLLGAQGLTSSTYSLMEGFLSSGYSLNQKHLIWMSPFFSYASVSGVVSLSNSSANQFGINLGYQYSIESLLMSVESSWVSGSMGSSKISGFSGGASIGLELGTPAK